MSGKQLELGEIEVSIIIPTLNSENYISNSLATIAAALMEFDLTSEIIVVDDGSTDATWEVLKHFAQTFSSRHIVAVRLAANSGQHAATLCGMRMSRGSIVVTMDDDLQNDPREIGKAMAGINTLKSEAVIVAYKDQKKSLMRKAGSWLTSEIVHFVFGKPRGLKLSPFRVMSRPMVDRICRTTHPQPYITGELLLASGSVSNIVGVHSARAAEGSRYGAKNILKLLARITFGYSMKPLVLVSLTSLAISTLFFIVVVLITVSKLVYSNQAPGWSSQAILLATFATFNFLVLSVLGAYVGQVLSRVSNREPYSVLESTREVS